MARYASGTSVSPEKSQEEIKRLLRRYGADSFGVMERAGQAAVLFQYKKLSIQIVVSLPDQQDLAYTTTETGRDRSESAALKAWEQDIKSRWRALLLAIKAKLEAVEVGISTIEQEFLPFVVMPDGRTLAQHVTPKLIEYAETGNMPQLLALPEGGRP